MTPLMLLAFLSAVTGRSPAAPTVGDPIAIEFRISNGERLEVQPSPDYEIVSVGRDRAVVRTFRPHAIVVHAAIVGPGGRREVPVEVPVRSVLAPRDSYQPAPLAPPRPAAPPRLPLVLIAAAAAIAGASWLILWLVERGRSRASEPVHVTAPAAEFMAAVAGIRRDRRRRDRAAALADATRRYLARVDPGRCGVELTSSELRHAIARDASPEWVVLVSEILTAGDLEKFSPWGTPGELTGRLLQEAAAVPEPFEPPAEVAA